MANNKTPIGGGGTAQDGTVTGASNVGTGSPVFKEKLANALIFRTLKAAPGLEVLETADELTVRFAEDMATQAELALVSAEVNALQEGLQSTGIVDEHNETFNLTRISASTLRVSTIAAAVFDQDFGVFTVPQTDLDVSAMLAGLSTGTYIKHLHLQKPDTFVFRNSRTSDEIGLMPLGAVLVLSNAGTVTLSLDVDPLPQPGMAIVTLYDLENSPSRIELTTGPNADLTLYSESGYYFGEAVNWANKQNVYKLPIPADNILSYRYVSPAIAVSSTVAPEVTSVDATKYWNGTALVSVPSNNNATIQRLAWVPVLRSYAIQYGEVVYPTLQDAINALDTDTFTGIFAGSQAIEVARFAVRKSATNLNDTSQCIYVVAGESLGGVSGGTGGNTNLSTSLTATNVSVNSDTGTDALIPGATATEAGVMSAADKTKLDGLSGGNGDVVGPASATADAIALFNGATGKIIKSGPLITTSASDATAGRITKVGDFGLGWYAIDGIASDCNNLGNTGFYTIGSSTVNGPGYGAALYVNWRNALTITQLAIGTTRAAMRTFASGTWGAWVEIATSTNSLGQGQTWQDVTASRALNTIYTNSTGRPIDVIINGIHSVNSPLVMTINGVYVWISSATATNRFTSASVTIPNGATYSASMQNAGATTELLWQELR